MDGPDGRDMETQHVSVQGLLCARPWRHSGRQLQGEAGMASKTKQLRTSCLGRRNIPGPLSGGKS